MSSITKMLKYRKVISYTRDDIFDFLLIHTHFTSNKKFHQDYARIEIQLFQHEQG